MGSELCTSRTCLPPNTPLYFAHPIFPFFFFLFPYENITKWLPITSSFFCSGGGRPTSRIFPDYSALSMEAPVSARFSGVKYHAILRFFVLF